MVMARYTRVPAPSALLNQHFWRYKLRYLYFPKVPEEIQMFCQAWNPGLEKSTHISSLVLLKLIPVSGVWVLTYSHFSPLTFHFNYSKSYLIPPFKVTNRLYFLTHGWYCFTSLFCYVSLTIIYVPKVWTLSLLFTVLIPMLRRGLGLQKMHTKCSQNGWINLGDLGILGGGGHAYVM